MGKITVQQHDAEYRLLIKTKYSEPFGTKLDHVGSVVLEFHQKCDFGPPSKVQTSRN